MGMDMNKGDIVETFILRRANSGRYICPVPQVRSNQDISISEDLIEQSEFDVGDKVAVELWNRDGGYFEVSSICDINVDTDYSISEFGRGVYQKKFSSRKMDKIDESDTSPENPDAVRSEPTDRRAKSDEQNQSSENNDSEFGQLRQADRTRERKSTTEANKTSNSENDIQDLRKQAEEAAVEDVPENVSTNMSTTPQYSRSKKVKEYVKARADGVCEGCGDPAPFVSKTGKPYLHAHHLHELSDGGTDTPETVIALCPNCHYEVHHGEYGEEYNNQLLEEIERIEG